MSRLAALKEYAYLKVLHEHGFPVPAPFDVNRHCVVMELIDARLLANIPALQHPGKVYKVLSSIHTRL